MNKKQRYSGFTIVELLIVIVVIGILAAITIVAYNGVQTRAMNARAQSDIVNVQKQVEAYNATNGSYPSTGGINVVRSDANCSGGSKQTDWVPNLSVSLPQSSANSGLGGNRGCYMYASDGTNYVLSAWNGVSGGPQNSTLYRRLGFREIGFASANSYYCNHVNIGGSASGTYVITSDYYKYSYTVSNISNCNETPPPGA